MENWNLKDLGVQEMNETDVNAINGGLNPWVPLFVWLVINELQDTSSGDDFQNGRDTAKSFWY
jgi:hypothetical protein